MTLTTKPKTAEQLWDNIDKSDYSEYLKTLTYILFTITGDFKTNAESIQKALKENTEEEITASLINTLEGSLNLTFISEETFNVEISKPLVEFSWYNPANLSKVITYISILCLHTENKQADLKSCLERLNLSASNVTHMTKTFNYFIGSNAEFTKLGLAINPDPVLDNFRQYFIPSPNETLTFPLNTSKEVLTEFLIKELLRNEKSQQFNLPTIILGDN